MSENRNSVANESSHLEIAQSNQDLIISKEKGKRRKIIIIAVICAITASLVIAAIILLTTGDNKDIISTENALNLEDFLHGKFSPKTFNATWTSDNQLLYGDALGNLLQYDLTTRKSKVLINISNSVLEGAFDFQLSADKSYLLIGYRYQKIYRHSFLAQYSIYDLNTRTKLDSINNGKPVQLVVWAPVDNAFAYVFENNIYYKKSVSEETAVAITSTKGYVSNGVPDWVYEEEVFSSNRALWFSPDGTKLAYCRFDDTNVPLMVVPVYGEPGKLTSQYPRGNLIKYPKAGAQNPTVSLHFVNLVEPDTEYSLEEPEDFKNGSILSTIEWANNNVLLVIWMNRVQNQAVILSYGLSSTQITSTRVKKLESKDGWLDLFTPPVHSKDGSQFVLILSQKQEGSSDSFRHIVLFTNQEDTKSEALTKGKFVVTSILGWNSADNLIYYLANTEHDSSVQHLYSISPDTKKTNCITCNRKSAHDSSIPCSYNSAEFNKDMSYYVLTCAGPDVPQVSIHSTDHTEIVMWANNAELFKYLEEKETPTIKKISFNISDDMKANVLLRIPPNLDISGETTYPMIVNVYGGPDTYQVTDKFVLDWGSYLASNKSIIYAAIDGRGSGLKGDKIMFAGYRKLGTVEIEDQVKVTRLIQKAFPFVDSKRIAIWGWSYGGYAAGMALATDTENTFKCGISVAPVTDWILYDSIYTERFMGLPTVSDNLEGYQRAQLLKKFEGLRDKEYFLIHGTYDDNVHYQQSMLWSKVLEQNDILFRQQVYPDEDHSLALVRPHLYHSLEAFLDECFEDTNK